jgi:hypothetical protein
MRATNPPYEVVAYYGSRGHRLDAQPPSGATTPASTNPNVTETNAQPPKDDSPRRHPQEGSDDDNFFAYSG